MALGGTHHDGSNLLQVSSDLKGLGGALRSHHRRLESFIGTLYHPRQRPLACSLPRERLFDLLLFLSPCCKPLLALHLWRELDQSIVLELCKLLRGGGRRHRRRRAAQAPGNCATEDDSTRTAP